jgi:C-terminal processing protease CtpA/Prc
MAAKQFILDTTIQAEIVQSLSEKLRANYVFPEIAEQICVCLQKHLEDGDYTDITEGDFFALALTLHMQEVNHDEHLWVKWHPEPLPVDEVPLRLNQEWQDERKLEARLDNYGLRRVERLPGNIGYLDIHNFHRPAWGGDTAVAAMNFLANAQALIIDLRKCTGGYPGMIALISSYLFGEEPVHLDSIYWRDDDITQQYWTLPYVPGKRFIDKPVYVLISKVTFSGGEGFAYILQTRKRATLLGEKTDGGAHAGASYRLHSHFEVFIPIGRSINPMTGTNWEGIGVTPDISIPPEQAFNMAYKMALESILVSLGDSPSGPFKALAEEAQAALEKGFQTLPDDSG